MPAAIFALPAIASSAASAAAGVGAALTSNAAGALTLGSGALGALGSVSRGIYGQRTAALQADEARGDAQQALTRSGEQIATNDYATGRAIGRLRASAAAAGVQPGGSPEQVIDEAGQRQSVDDMYSRYSGQLAAHQDLFRAAIAQNQGDSALSSGLLGGATSLLTAGMRARGLGYPTPVVV